MEAIAATHVFAGELVYPGRITERKCDTISFFRASDVHGPTALYGGFVRSMELMQSDLATRFRQTLEEIQSGDFARQFQAEREAGYPTLTLARSMTAEQGPTAQPIAQAEAQMRAALASLQGS